MLVGFLSLTIKPISIFYRLSPRIRLVERMKEACRMHLLLNRLVEKEGLALFVPSKKEYMYLARTLAAFFLCF